MKNNEIAKQAVKHIKSEKKQLIEKFASLEEYPPSDNPEAIFMAGSPGVGKTEYAKGLKKTLEEKNPDKHIVHIDADEIKKEIPGYDGSNSEDYQGASSLGVQKILDKVLHRKQDFILDGRFSNLKLAQENIKRALKHGFKIVIFYIYQDPLIAWDFTKRRKDLYKRYVPKDVFVNGLFDSMTCTDKIKEEFGKNIELDIVIQNISNTEEKKSHFNAQKVANHVKINYNSISLLKELK